MRALRIAALAVVTLAVGGCASLACTPVTIVVRDKEERSVLVSQPRGLRTDELGRVKEERRDAIEHQYWVRDDEGRWSRVSPTDWAGAQIGRPLGICR